MISSFEESYMSQLRKLVGQKRIIVPGVRAVIRDSEGRVLLVHRTDSGRWGMPAGAVEIGDSALVFRVDKWDGDLVRETDETMGAEFFALDNLPDLHEVYVETLNDLKNYNGEFIVK